MTNELVKIELTNNDGFPRRYAVASGVAITKGTLLRLTDARTASTSIVAPCPCAGVASMDKEADDYSTSITCWTDGIFKAICSGAISVGEPVAMGGSGNYVMAVSGALSQASGSILIGYSLETAADEETFQFRLRL